MLSTFDGPQLKRRCDRFALIRFGSRIRVFPITACDGRLMKKRRCCGELVGSTSRILFWLDA
jgi:hypothetical protein